MTSVRGHCPVDGADLILGKDGQLWCGDLLCERPTAAAEILADAETGHVVSIGSDGAFTIRHPLRERLDDALMRCELHRFLADGAVSIAPGRYRVAGMPDSGLTWEALPG